MYLSDRRKWRARTIACTSILALLVSGFGSSAQAQADPDKAADTIKTATPIKHVIIIVIIDEERRNQSATSEN